MEQMQDADATATPAPKRRRRRIRWLAGGLVVAAGAAWVAFGWFGVHLLFVDESVDEAAPVFSTGPDTPSTQAAPGAAPPVTEPRAGPTLAGAFTGVDHGASGTVVVLEGDGRRVLRFESDFSTSNGPDLFVYLGTGDGNYRDAGSYIELGPLKGNEGSQNYEIPPEVDLTQFRTVAVWCKRFDSTFAVASLA